jgi:large subunit ribosomal protein L15
MKMHELSPAPGSRKDRKRVGRGDGSGHGTYSGRGLKGAKQRAGNETSRSFEGGQLSLVKRLPGKRGFTNIFRIEYSEVNVDKLNIFEKEKEVNPEKLAAAGLIKSAKRPVKILGDGELACALVVKASKFTATAKTKIEAAGGKAEEIKDAAKAD